MADKLYNYCLREARKDIIFAKTKLKDKDWLDRASNMSKQMVSTNAKLTPAELAKSSCNYLKMRACAKGNLYGQATWIDNAARIKIKKITGKYPICSKIKW